MEGMIEQKLELMLKDFEENREIFREQKAVYSTAFCEGALNVIVTILHELRKETE